MIISTTKFELKSLLLYAEFFIDTYRVVKQIRGSGGIIKVRIKPFSLRTITAWISEEQMLAFRNSGAHMDAMRKTKSFGSIQSTTWESTEIPSWREAIDRLNVQDV